METLQPLSIESFSFKWVINLKPSLGDSFRDEAAFIEMTPSSRDFNFPTAKSSSMLVHADEVFSNGLLMPCFLKEHDDDALNHSTKHSYPSYLVRCWKSWRKVVKKHLCFVSHKVGDSNSSTRAAADARAESESPRTSTDYLIRDWSDIENSIQEAVLHCKLSFER